MVVAMLEVERSGARAMMGVGDEVGMVKDGAEVQDLKGGRHDKVQCETRCRGLMTDRLRQMGL